MSLYSSTSFADTQNEEKACLDIGFKPKTQKFSNCVLELYQRRPAETNRSTLDTRPSQVSTDMEVRGGDGTEDDQTCQRYGFLPGSSGYSECRMRIDLAKREADRRRIAYEEEQRIHSERLAAAERERQRQIDVRALELGLRMMGGQPPVSAAASVGTGAAILPPTPPSLTQTIILPGSRAITCTTNGTVTNCF